MTTNSNLEFIPKNAWDVYGSKEDLKNIENLAQKYMKFLSTCKTERETVEYIKKELTPFGFKDGEVTKDLFLDSIQGKALFAARKGKKPLNEGLHIIFAHTDTPRLDLKQRPLQEQSGVAQFKTHYYGGIKKYQWFARPLALHGVVVKTNGESLQVNIGEEPGDPVFAISDLLPHLAAKQMDESLRNAFEAEKMNIIVGHKAKSNKKNECKDKEAKDPIRNNILELLHKKYGIIEEDLYSAELQAVPAGKACEVGLDRAIIGGYGHDDRICVFLALESLLANIKTQPEYTQCIVLLDKEEIGSEGSTGAKSRFFEYAVQELIEAWDKKAKFSKVMLNSRAISADTHGAVDPDWQELHEKLNSATLGYGPCFCKYTGSRGKYEANDAHPEYIAWLRKILNEQNIPWQMAELGKVDIGGGGTVAMYFASYGMNIIDCGPAILSMHSPFEMASKVDLYASLKTYTAFLNAK